VFAKRFLSDVKGATAVEFALVLPAFLMMVLGIFWSAWAIHCTQSVRYALSEGARVVQLNPAITQTELQTFVRNNVNIGDDSGSVTVTLTFDPVAGGTQLAHTTATYPLSFTIPWLGTYAASYSVSLTVPVLAS